MSSEITITPREKDISAIFFIVAILAFMGFVLAMALAEYTTVEYARTVVGELPVYLVFAFIIIVIFAVAWIKARGSVDKAGIWKY